MKSNRTSGTRGRTYHAGELPRRMEGVARSHAREARERGRKLDAARSRVFMWLALILRKKPTVLQSKLQDVYVLCIVNLSLTHMYSNLKYIIISLLETFRVEDENDYEYEI